MGAAGGVARRGPTRRVGEVVERAVWLPESERALVNWVRETGRPLSELAATMGVRSWTLQRRLRATLAKVMTPGYRHVVAQLEVASDPPPWPPREAGDAMSEERLALSIGRGLFIAGKSVRAVAAALGVDRRIVQWRRERLMLEAGAEKRRRAVR